MSEATTMTSGAEGGGEGAKTPASSAPAAPADWRSGLPEDLRANPTLQRFEGTADGLAALAKEHVHVQKLIGGEKIVLPGKDADPSEWGRVYDRLGRPEKPDQYDLGDFAPPEGLPWSAEFQTEALAKLHEMGLNHQQAKGILGWYAGRQGEVWNELRANAERSRETTEQALKSKYGRAYDARIDLGRRTFNKAAGSSEAAQQIAAIRLEDGTLLGNHPEFVEMFARLGDLVAEHGIVGDKETRLTKTPEEATSEWRRLQANEQFMDALMRREHPEHEDAVRRRSDLFRAMHPGS